jgi:superfamily II DNA helicase RecQ
VTRRFRYKLRRCLVSSHVSGSIVRAVLAVEDVITVAPTGSGKSLTYWIPLLYIKHGITVVVSPLKLLGTQFVEMLGDNQISVTAQTSCLR